MTPRIKFLSGPGLWLAALFIVTSVSARTEVGPTGGEALWLWLAIALVGYAFLHAVGSVTIATAAGMLGSALAVGQLIRQLVPRAATANQLVVLAPIAVVTTGLCLRPTRMAPRSSGWLIAGWLVYLLGIATDSVLNWMGTYRTSWAVGGALIFGALLLRAVRNAVNHDAGPSLAAASDLYLVGLNLWLAVRAVLAPG